MGTNVHEFQSEKHATDNVKHLLNSNTCIYSNIDKKNVILPHKKCIPKQNSPPITLSVWDNNIL